MGIAHPGVSVSLQCVGPTVWRTNGKKCKENFQDMTIRSPLIP